LNATRLSTFDDNEHNTDRHALKVRNLIVYFNFTTSNNGQYDKEIRSRVIQARKCIACLNGILWSKDVRREN